MANRPNKQRHVRSLMNHASGTYLVSLPVEYIRELKWRGKQKVVVELRGKSIVVTDWKPKS